MSLGDNSLILMTPTMTISSGDSRSISPLTPSPSREMRGIRLFRAISRRLAKSSRRQNDFEEDDSRSSSTDSSCSVKKGNGSYSSSAESGFRSVSPHHLSSSSSDAGSDSSKSRHPLSTSAESIRKVFRNLSINTPTRSKSCTSSKDRKCKSSSTSSSSNKSKTPPKKILRAPTSYTYVKGLSGLPTQRVPKASHRVYMNNCGGCSMQYTAALHR